MGLLLPLLLAGLTAMLSTLWLVPLIMAFRSWRFLARARPKPPTDYHPPVALIAPCRGVEQGFENNVQAMLAQDYPDYRVLFVVDSTEDPAYPVLARIVRQHTAARRFPSARVLVAGKAVDRGRKIHNLLAGVAAADDAEVLAFVDSDARPHATWLSSLVAPLADPSVGGSSGHFWYRPECGGLWSWARAYAANLTALNMAYEGSSGLWGGAMAVRREVFEQAAVAAAWAHALSDDIVMARQIDRLGLKTVLVPECFTTIIEDCTFGQFWEYVLRHFVLARACDTRLWALVGVVLALPVVAGIGSGGSLIAALFVREALLIAALFLVQFPLQIVYGAAVSAAIFRDYEMALAAPLLLVVEPVVAMAYLASALTRRLTWRDITYEVRSADEVRVLSPEEANSDRLRLAHLATSVRTLPKQAHRLAAAVVGGWA